MRLELYVSRFSTITLVPLKFCRKLADTIRYSKVSSSAVTVASFNPVKDAKNMPFTNVQSETVYSPPEDRGRSEYAV